MATPSQLIAIYGETLVGVSAADQEAPRVFARVKRQNQRLVNRTLTRAGFPTAGVPLETGAEGGPVSAIGGGSATAIGVTASATCGGSGSAIGTADDQSDSSEGFSHTFQEGIHTSWNRHDARFYREGDGRDSSPRIWNSPAAPLRDERDMSPGRGIPPTPETLQKHADIQALEEFKEFPATQMEPASGRRSRSRSPSQAQISSGDSQISRMPGDPSPSEGSPSSLPRRLASAAPREKSSQPLAAATEKKEEEPSDHDTMPQTKKEEDDDNTQPQQTKKEAVQVDATRPDALEQAQIAAVIAASLIEVGSIDLVPDAPQREAAPEQPFASAQFVPPADVADVTVEYGWYRQPPLAPMVESDPRPAFGGHTRGQKPCVAVRDPIHHKTPSDWLFDQLRRGSRDQDIRNYIAAFGATQEEARFQSAVLELLEKVLVKRCTPRGPPQKKLLLDIREKLRGFDPGRARLQGGTMPELISGVDALPGVGVRFDADWTNVSAIMGMLEKCEVAEPCDHTGNWKLVHSIIADFQRNLDPTIH